MWEFDLTGCSDEGSLTGILVTNDHNPGQWQVHIPPSQVTQLENSPGQSFDTATQDLEPFLLGI